jgi:uncharacterized protein
MTSTTEIKGAMPYVRIPQDGEPYLEGQKCGACGEIYLGPRRACGNCLAVGGFAPVRLSTTGRLYNYTIVYRSFPGIKTPFVSATVDLDGGGTIRGNLVDVEADPKAVTFDMPVKMVFRDTGLSDESGATFISHYFVPAEEA